MATFNAAEVYTLKELRQFYEADGRLATIIKMLYQDNPILEHAKWIRTNETDTHKRKILTKLPKPAWRRLYKGTARTKSGIATVKDTCRQMSDRWEIDVDELKLYDGDEEKSAFRMQEGSHHIEGMRQFWAERLFYGDHRVDADDVNGLHARYPYKDAPNVVDAGATSGDTCSIWAVVWAQNEDNKGLACIYPKNTKAGIEHEDLGTYDAHDSDGKPFRVVGDEWKWNVGVSIGDWRYVARICNIPVAKLEIPVGETDFVDLKKLTIKAKNKVPTTVRKRIHWYVPNCIMTALEFQASDRNAVHLRYGQYFDSHEVLKLHNLPVFECDALLETESPLPATP